MTIELGPRTRTLRVVAAACFCLSCSDASDSADQGRSDQASTHQAPSPTGVPGSTAARAEPAPSTSSLDPALPRPEISANPEDATIRAPDGEAGDAAVAATDASSGHRDDGLTCYPLLAHNGDLKTPYAVGLAKDSYVAFTFAAPWSETAYAVTFQPVLDNKRVVHHWLLFQDNNSGVPGDTVQESVVPGAHPDAQLISAWTPGTNPLDFRSLGVDVGLELPHDTTYTLEFHYNSSDSTAVDRSGVEVCTSPRKPAHTAGYSWLGSENWLVPSDTWSGTCRPSASEPIHILAIVPHMHYKGHHMRATLRRADGSEEVFHDRDFDFAYESLYPLDLTLQPGDSVVTTCTYSEPTTYGPSVNDEMCYMFTVAYPRGALVSPDLVGGLLHGGTSCFGE